jgi:hypothetical protein
LRSALSQKGRGDLTGPNLYPKRLNSWATCGGSKAASMDLRAGSGGGNGFPYLVSLLAKTNKMPAVRSSRFEIPQACLRNSSNLFPRSLGIRIVRLTVNLASSGKPLRSHRTTSATLRPISRAHSIPVRTIRCFEMSAERPKGLPASVLAAGSLYRSALFRCSKCPRITTTHCVTTCAWTFTVRRIFRRVEEMSGSGF